MQAEATLFGNHRHISMASSLASHTSTVVTLMNKYKYRSTQLVPYLMVRRFFLLRSKVGVLSILNAAKQDNLCSSIIRTHEDV